jgi:hypothetical protein
LNARLNDEVTKARHYLHHVVIPEFAEKLKDPQFTESFFPSVYHPSFIFNQKRVPLPPLPSDTYSS